MSSELENASKILKKCPICDTSNSFKISGFLLKSLECKNCKAQWTAGSYDDGKKWLKLMRASKNGLGSVKSGILYRDFFFDFWQNEDKPFQKFEDFASLVFDNFKDFANFRQDIGQAEFKDGHEGIWFIGPTIDVVATMNLYAEKKNGDYEIFLRVIDQTSMIKDKNRERNDLFLFMISKKLFILLEETGIPVTPYIIPKGETIGKKVKENWFYPFKERRKVAVRKGFDEQIFQAFTQLEPKHKK